MQDRSTIPPVISATSAIGTKVCNPQGEDLGKIEEVMLDTEHRRIAYAVLSFGGFMGFGDKLFAIPWERLCLVDEDCYELDIERERLEAAEGFDKSNWPQFADRRWGRTVYDHYAVPPYWD